MSGIGVTVSKLIPLCTVRQQRPSGHVLHLSLKHMQVCLCVLHALLRGHICVSQECHAVHFVAPPFLTLHTEISSRSDEFCRTVSDLPLNPNAGSF